MRADYYTDFQCEVLQTMRDLKKDRQHEVEISEIAETLEKSVCSPSHSMKEETKTPFSILE